MEHMDLNIKYSVATINDLSEADRALVEQARLATHRSYAPYSKFSVGAAIQLDNGEIITGANQENVAYPSGTCAERTACYYAHALYPDANFSAIAIAARGTDGNEVTLPIAPCGACRQALLEYETLAGKDVRVILTGSEKVIILPSVKSLLPFAFSEFS
jgi:cytidine deaminase